jgi:N6-L-threonylcarbamoyladenine synthase
MEGHLFATSLEHPAAVPPFTALLVSGGHTLLLDVPAWGQYQVIGRTRDDAAGEAFDKVAKLLGLPYPGGRHIEHHAALGDPARYRFPRPMVRRNQRPDDPDFFDVSFSGLKTAVLLAVKACDDVAAQLPHLARGFQDAVIDTLAEKVARGVTQFARETVVLGGGVACNKALVRAITERCGSLGAAVHAPSTRLATDNAAMIARAGLWRYERGERSDASLNAYATAALPTA